MPARFSVYGCWLVDKDGQSFNTSASRSDSIPKALNKTPPSRNAAQSKILPAVCECIGMRSSTTKLGK